MNSITRTIEENNDAIKQASVNVTRLLAQKERAEAQNQILKVLLDDQLRTFEFIWFQNERVFTIEHLSDYVRAAEYSARAFNRKNNIIKAVQALIKEKTI
jgi:hypothetical protein